MQPLPDFELDLEVIKASYNNTMEKVIASSSNRFLTHIQTDKVVYRPGENMFIQAYVFEALNKTPAYSSLLNNKD